MTASLDRLIDEVSELVADARMRHVRVPRVRFEWDLEAGTHTLVVVVDGAIVATGIGASLDVAARRAYQEFVGWHEDSPAGLTRALTTSIAIARTERAASAR